MRNSVSWRFCLEGDDLKLFSSNVTSQKECESGNPKWTLVKHFKTELKEWCGHFVGNKQ